MIEHFGKVSSAFKQFDLRTLGYVTFSDFAYVIDTMKLNLNRDTIMQMFTYMDSNQDNMLKYPDFCKLCSEFVYKNYKQDGMSDPSRGNSEVNDPFLVLLRSLKAKGHATPKGVKGFGAVEKRIDNKHKPVPRENYEGVKNANQLMDTEYVSEEL